MTGPRTELTGLRTELTGPRTELTGLRPELTGLRSSQVAAAAGVNVQTLRYYERRGLLTPPERSLGGHRLYPNETVTALRVIKAAQRLGFTLDEVADLLATGRHLHGLGRPRGDGLGRPRGDGLGKPRGDGLQARALAKLAEVEARIADLEVIAHTLRAAVDAGCDDLESCASNACCPIPFTELAGRAASAGKDT